MTNPIEAAERARAFKDLQVTLRGETTVLAAALRRTAMGTPDSRAQALAACLRVERTARELAASASALTAGIEADLRAMEGTSE